MRFLFPEGVRSLLEAVNLIEQNKAPKIVQTEEGATYDPMLNKKELYRLNVNELDGKSLHNFIRGCDTVPGAWVKIDGQECKLYGSKRWIKSIPFNAKEITIDGKFNVLLEDL